MAPAEFPSALLPLAPAPAMTASSAPSSSSASAAQWQIDALNSALIVPLAVRRAAAAAKHLVASEVAVVAGAAEEGLRCVQTAMMDATHLTMPAPALLHASRPAPEPPVRRSSVPREQPPPALRITLTSYDDAAVPLSTIAIPLSSLPRQSWPEKVEHRQAMPAHAGPHASFGWDGRPIADRRCLFPAPIDCRGRGMDGGRCWSRRGLGYEVVRATPMRFAEPSRGRSTAARAQEANAGAPLQRCPSSSIISSEPLPNPHEAKPIDIAIPSITITPSESATPYSPRTHAARRSLRARSNSNSSGSSSNASFLPAGTVAFVEACPSSGTQPRMKLSIRSTSPMPAVQAEVARAAAVFNAAPQPPSLLPDLLSSDEEDSLHASSEDDASNEDDDSESELPYVRQRASSTGSDATTASSSASSSEDSELETESDTELSSEYDSGSGDDEDEARPHKSFKLNGSHGGKEGSRKRSRGYGSGGAPYSALRRLAAAAAAGRRGAVCSLPEALEQAWQAPLLLPLAPSEKRARTPFALGDDSDADSSADAEGETDDEAAQPPGAFHFQTRRNALRIA